MLGATIGAIRCVLVVGGYRGNTVHSKLIMIKDIIMDVHFRGKIIGLGAHFASTHGHFRLVSAKA